MPTQLTPPKLILEGHSARNYTYADILEGLKDLDLFLDSLEIKVAPTDRVHKAIKQLREANKLLGTPAYNAYLKKVDVDGEFFFGINTLQEVRHALSYLNGKDQKSRVLREKFKKAFSGTSHPKDETPVNSEARNTMFELFLTAELNRCGYSAVLGDPNPDILAKVNSRRYFFECKRVWSEKSIPDRIRDAMNQLNRELRAKHNQVGDKGVIAISVERVFTKEGGFLYAESPETAIRTLQKSLDGVLDKYQSLWKNPKSKRIVAVILIISCTARFKDGTPDSWCRQMLINDTGKDTISKFPTFVRDFSGLTTSLGK